MDVRCVPNHRTRCMMHCTQNVEVDLCLMRAIAVNWVTSESCYTFFLSGSYFLFSFYVVVVALIWLLPYRFDDQIKFYFPIFLCERLSARFGDCTATQATKKPPQLCTIHILLCVCDYQQTFFTHTNTRFTLSASLMMVKYIAFVK